MATELDAAELENWLEGQVMLHPAAAAAVAVSGAGGRAALQFGEARGPAGRDRIAMGCLTKSFTAHAVLRLVQQGRLSLEDRLADILGAGAEIALPDGICIGHLLAHTSGLAEPPGDPFYRRLQKPWPSGDEPFVIGAVAGPGEVYRYDNTNYIALGMVLRLLTGRQWLDAVRELALAPLADQGLADALPPYGEETAGGQDNHIGAWTHDVAMSAEDLARFAEIHARPEAQDADTAAIVQQLRDQPDWAPRLGHTDIRGFCFKHMANGDFGHFGDAAFGRVGLYASPRNERGAAVIVAGQVAPLYQEILAKLDLMAAPASIQAILRDGPPSSPEAYLGLYRSGPFDIRISSGPQGLKAQLGDAFREGAYNLPPELPIRPVRPRLYQYFVPYMPQYFEFVGEETAADFPYLRYRDLLLRKEGDGA